jgi:nucleoside-diphosphate-sugar epimerase
VEQATGFAVLRRAAGGGKLRVLLVGANSYIGQSVAALMLRHEFEVSALARTEESAERLKRRGLTPVPGDIFDIGRTTGGLSGYDACVWLSFLSLDAESTAVRALLACIAGQDKSFIFTSGTAVLGIPSEQGTPSEASFAEDDPFAPLDLLRERVMTEHAVRAAANNGVRAMVIRPPMVWGNGGSRQIPWLFETVRKTGAACFIGHGLNAYSHVHVDDLAEVYLRALRNGRAGALYHAVAGEVNFRTIASAIADVCGCSFRSVNLEEMCDLLGRSVAQIGFAINSRSRCPRTHRELGWNAANLELIEDIRSGSYSRCFAST